MRHRFFFSSVIPVVSAIALGSALALYVQQRIGLTRQLTNPAAPAAQPTPAEQPTAPVVQPTPAEQPATPATQPTPTTEKIFKHLEKYTPYTPHPLFIAAEQGDIEKVKSLLASGQDINMKNFCGFAPLHAAICAKQPQMAHFLIENGADVNLTDHLNRNPLMLAALHRQTETVYMLLKAGADRSHTDFQQKSIYFYAKAGGVPELISLFGF